MAGNAVLSSNIRAARLAKGKSVSWLAGKVGVSRVAVVHWEANTNAPKLKHLVVISKVLGVGVNDLMTKRRSAS